jgi:hypothetical protein
MERNAMKSGGPGRAYLGQGLFFRSILPQFGRWTMSWHKRLLFSAAIVSTAFSGIIFASTFFIVRKKNGTCKVVEGHPPPTMTIIGSNKSYATREEAEKDMALACKTG